jgi:hypothetical protein
MRGRSWAAFLLVLAGCKPSSPSTLPVTAETPEPTTVQIVDMTVVAPRMEPAEGACVVLGDGRGRCWGHHPAFRTMFEGVDEEQAVIARATTIDAPPLRMLRLGTEIAVGLTQDGKLWFWNDEGRSMRDDGFDEIAVGYRTVCARRSSTIACWIGSAHELAERIDSSDPITLEIADELPPGPLWIHAEGHVMGVIGTETVTRFSLEALREVDISGDEGVRSVAMPSSEEVPHPPAWTWTLRDHPGRAEWPSAFGDQVCRLASGRVHCVVGSRVDPAEIHEDALESRIVARGVTHLGLTSERTLCVANGPRLACEGEQAQQMQADIVRIEPLAEGGIAVTMADGKQRAKSGIDDGTETPQADPPAARTAKPDDDPSIRAWAKDRDALVLASSDRGGCALFGDGTIECRSRSVHGERDPGPRPVRLPEGFRAQDLQGRSDRMCALGDGGDVACWSMGPERPEIGRGRRTWVDLTDWILAD